MSENFPPPPPPSEPTGPVVPRPAELLDRFLARLIDGILLAFVQFVIIGGVLVGAIVASGASDLVVWVGGAIATLVSLAVTLAYYVYFETSSGQTLGKLALKLKVTGPGGAKVTTEQSLRRNGFYFLNLIGLVPIIGGLIGGLATLAAVIYIAVTINGDVPLRQGWHDKFAGETYVTKVG